MNVDLRLSTYLMVEESPAKAEAGAFIDWLQSEGYTDYVIDCHVRRLLGVSGCGVAAARRPPSPLRDRSRRVTPSTLGV